MRNTGITLIMNFTTLIYNTTSGLQPTDRQTDSIETTEPPSRLDNFIYYSEAYVQTTILCVGFIFNTVNLIVLRRSKIAKTFRLCLVALTCTDLCACFFGILQLIVEVVYFDGSIPFGYYYGAALATHLLYYTFILFLCISSTYVIMVASVRAYMIVQPYTASEKLKPRKITIILAILFIAVVVCFVPTPLYAIWQVCYKETEAEFCSAYFHRLPNISYMQYYLFMISVVFGPFVIIANIACLITIKSALKKSQARLIKMNKKEDKKHRHYQRITRMLLIILILDTFWLLPTCIQYLGFACSPENTLFDGKEPGFLIFDIIAEILLLFRPTYNIFVYLFTNREYRHSFVTLFCCSKLIFSDSTELKDSSSNDKDQSHEALNGIGKTASQLDVTAKDINVENGVGIREIDITAKDNVWNAIGKDNTNDSLQTDSDSGVILSHKDVFIFPKDNDKLS